MTAKGGSGISDAPPPLLVEPPHVPPETRHPLAQVHRCAPLSPHNTRYTFSTCVFDVRVEMLLQRHFHLHANERWQRQQLAKWEPTP